MRLNQRNYIKEISIKVAKTIGFEYFHSFGTIESTDQIITDSEIVLVKCISSNCNIGSFDELRYETYYDKNVNFNLKKFPPTSESIREHITQAYLQYYLWFHLSFNAGVKLNPLEYGYAEDDNEHLIPRFISGNHSFDDFPLRCNCLKFASANVCPSCIKQISCCKFCKREAADPGKNQFSDIG